MKGFEMNAKDLMLQKQASLRLLKFQDRMFKNCIRYSSVNAESDKHFSAKCVICRELTNKGLEFVTEARFEKTGRCDILILDLGLAIEILCSEKEENIANKMDHYPVELVYLKLKENMKVNDIKLWLEDVLG